MMQLNNETTKTFLAKYYRYLVIVIGLLIIGGGSFFLLWPQYQSLQQSGVLEYEAAVNTLESRQQYLSSLQVMENNYQVLDQRLIRSIDTVLPANQKSVILFEELELLLEGSGLIVQSMNIAPVADPTATQITNNIGDPVAAIDDPSVVADPSEIAKASLSSDIQKLSLTVNVTTGGSGYMHFKEFLQQLESYEHLLELESISFSPSTAGSTFVFNTYQRKSLETND